MAVQSTDQLGLFDENTSEFGEDPDYCRRQLITCLGNKRSLLEPIASAADSVARSLGKEKLRVWDGFSGSGAVSRLLKSMSLELHSSDIEPYAEATSGCYLSNQSEVPRQDLDTAVDRLNARLDEGLAPRGFIEKLYAPKSDDSIQKGERVFYTRDNARRLDGYRQLIDEEEPVLRPLLLGPLLSAASVHTNTAGVFKGFYKDRETGVGKFGGTGSDALERITRQIELSSPVFSNYECEAFVYRRDANELVRDLEGLDLAYFDPPYNQHPYGSNYFMLNLLTEYEEPREISRVSGIPKDWNRSDYNVRQHAFERLRDLIVEVDAKYVLLSYNNEGFVSPEDLRGLMTDLGSWTEVQLKHNTFRGSRNLRDRDIHVTEHLFLLQKGR